MPTIVIDGNSSGYRRSYKRTSKKKTTKKRKSAKVARINYSKLASAIKRAGVFKAPRRTYTRRTSARPVDPVLSQLKREDGTSSLAYEAAGMHDDSSAKRTREGPDIDGTALAYARLDPDEDGEL
jgi:hypothetical protein